MFDDQLEFESRRLAVLPPGHSSWRSWGEIVFSTSYSSESLAIYLWASPAASKYHSYSRVLTRLWKLVLYCFKDKLWHLYLFLCADSLSRAVRSSRGPPVFRRAGSDSWVFSRCSVVWQRSWYRRGIRRIDCCGFRGSLSYSYSSRFHLPWGFLRWHLVYRPTLRACSWSTNSPIYSYWTLFD